jgi:hypothetical protein
MSDLDQITQEQIALEFAQQIAGLRHVEVIFSLFSCDCGTLSLLVDLSETPKWKRPLVFRMAKKFSKAKGIRFSITPDRCPTCGRPKGVRVLHEMDFGKAGLERNEISIRGRPAVVTSAEVEDAIPSCN